MAYATGTVTGLRALLVQLNNFMVAQGWTLHDNLGVHDKVYFSDGELDDQHLYIRITADVRALNFSGQTTNYTPGQIVTGATSGATAYLVSVTDAGATGTIFITDIKGRFVSGEAISDPLGGLANASGKLFYPGDDLSPNSTTNALDWLNVRYYSHWNATTHAGVNEVGRLGPLLVNTHFNTHETPMGALRLSQPPKQTPIYQFYVPKDDFLDANTPFPSMSTNRRVWNGYGALASAPHAGTPSPRSYNGTLSNNLRHEHLGVLGTVVDTQSPNQNSDGSASFPFVDHATGHHKLFCWQASSTPAGMFQIVNMTTGATTACAAPPFSSSSVGRYTNVVWDGADAIFVMHGSTTNFARYSVSSDTWTALANIPVTPSSFGIYQDGYTPLYIPVGVITGVTQDEIWFALGNSASNSVQRYSVTANTWAVLELPASQTITPTGASLVWDQKRYVYCKNTPNQYANVIDLQNIGAGWTSTSFALVGEMALNSSPRFVLNEYACRVRASTTAPTTYHFVGDADGVAIVTTINGASWFARFGRFDSERATATANFAAGVTGGSVQDVPVDSSAGFIVGDNVNLVDRANGVVSPTVIVAVPNATSLRMFVPENMGSTAYVTADGANCSLISDHFHGVTSMGVGGVRPDMQPQLYRIVPTAADRDLKLAGSPSDNRKQLWPMEMKWSVQGQANTGKRGIVPNLYVCTGADGEIITDRDGNQFLVFTSEAIRLWVGSSSNKMAIGPIN